MYLPSSYSPSTSPALPIVFLFHGYGGSAANAESTFLMDPVAEKQGFVAVYPDGFLESWNAGGCCGYAATENVDDVGFVLQLLALLQTQLCIDSARVYATGLSNGAFFSHRLACEASTTFAAIAPVEGISLFCPCNPTEAVAVLEVEGTDDTNIPYNGGSVNGCPFVGADFPSVPATIDAWSQRLGCACTLENQTCQSQFLQDGDGTCVSLGQCSTGAQVVYCSVAGGGHAWSGGVSPQYNTADCSAAVGTFSASNAVWTFFAAHSKLNSSAISAGVPCPSYSVPNDGNLTSASARDHSCYYVIHLSALLSAILLLL